MIEVDSKYYLVDKCGFYKRGESSSDFGGLLELIEDFEDWTSKSKSIGDTKTFSSESLGEIRNVYFMDASKSKISNDRVIVLWNETLNVSGNVFGISTSKEIGNKTILKTGFDDENAIPGIPSYFWMIPDENLIVSLKFAHSTQGKIPFENYFHGFLANFSSNRVFNSDNEIIGYSRDGSGSPHASRYCPRFHMKRAPNDTEKNELMSRSAEITQILKKEKLFYSVEDHRGRLEEFFNGILEGFTATVAKSKDDGFRIINHRVQFQPSAKQVESIIDQHRDRPVDSHVINVGFVVAGRNRWLDKMHFSQSVDLEVDIKDKEIVDPDAIIKSLDSRRESLISAYKATKK